MISPLTYQPKMKISMKPISESNGLSRIFAAAIVNRQFCQLLLEEPQIALQNGYLGESFPLSNEERDLVVSIRAETLTDFAKQITMALRNQY